jgi:hypothetical protein
MGLVASKTCEYIRPDSSIEDNSQAELYEYYLVWLGVDGGVYNWLFEDFTLKERIRGEVVNTKSENITNLFRNVEKSIELVAEDLSENEFDIISKITRALVVRRYFKDGTYQELAILTRDIDKPKSQFRYNLALEVQEVEDPVMR